MKAETSNGPDAGAPPAPDVLAACALSSIPGVGASTLARIAATFTSLRQALGEGPAGLLAAAGKLRLKPEARDYLAHGPDLARLGLWAVDAAKKAGARVVLLGDEWYPRGLRDLPSPPPLLYVRGHLVPEALRAAVVGSRDAAEDGLELARSFGDALARSGVQVISGGARGIDTAAHEGAFWGQGTSVVVLGCGIDVPYPPENAGLFDRIAGGRGAVISEFAPGTPPSGKNFPRRNRIVAALAQCVVVVRAAMRSGALITADHAAALQRRIFAVPGDPRDPMAAGPNALLRSASVHAAPTPLDVLQAMGWPIADELKRTEPAAGASHEAGPGFPVGRQAPSPPPERELLDEASLRLWRLLDERTPAHVDDLALRSQIASPLLLRKLLELELKGMVVQRPGKYFLRR